MAKKKTVKKSTRKSANKKSHGELFDKHNNLIWLLPIFFIVAIVAVLALNNAFSPSLANEVVEVEESILLEDTGLNTSDPEGSSIIEP